jgi:predicted alpha/beta-hydrolase family hydrolase
MKPALRVHCARRMPFAQQTMEPEKLIIGVNDRESVTALLYPASKRERASVTVVLGHGAGANQLSGFMRMVAGGLAARGIDAMTFNFLYSERGRHLPDPKARLESCYQAVIKTALTHRKLKKNRLVIGGKSMGGRIASQVAAAQPDGIAGLVFLGYPLHPPGRPDKLRADHLKDIHAPMLFVQGARDTFGTSEEIRAVIEKLRLPATLYAVEGGDHSFKVPKRSGVAQEKVYETIMDKVADWTRRLTLARKSTPPA